MLPNGDEGFGFTDAIGRLDAVVGDDHARFPRAQAVPSTVGAVPGQRMPIDGRRMFWFTCLTQGFLGHDAAGHGLIALGRPQIRPLQPFGDVGGKAVAVGNHGLKGIDAAGKSFRRQIGEDGIVQHLDAGEGQPPGFVGHGSGR